ncbi:MAG TPA: amidohydrolase family protein [Candidatus Acidoferrales bacterium]|jgi:predicted TIM-barrel fold metal-dependent hydrolase|nr:amidohydrolase family protein [Candidatus Acidoferrales bacterium]
MPVDISPACDCHVHVVGPLANFPQSATRSYTAAEASLETLQALGTPERVSRFVLVQASFYGTDNSCLLAALDKLGPNGRGVVAADLKNSAPQFLQEYEIRGVRGLRVNLYSKSLLFAPERICHLVQSAMNHVPSKRWHVEIIAPLSLLLNAYKIIADSRVPVVLDHYALPGAASPHSSEARRLLELMALPHVWIKLSAPYRVLADPFATYPPADWLAALLQAAPDRCIWGSDWPHTPLDADQRHCDEIASYRKINYSRLFQDFVRALPEAALARRILVENPQRLYGFQAG